MHAQVRVNRKAAGRVASGHPWIFRSDVVHDGGAEPGAAVEVAAENGRPLGTAHFSSTSQIALRMLSPGVEAAGQPFFHQRIAAAEQFRRRVVRDTDAYRVVYGEADLLPALVVDRYGDYLAVQTLSQGMERAKPLIAAALLEVFPARGIVARNDVAVRRHEALPLETAVLFGEIPDSVRLNMNGLVFHADILHGQKTGIYLDQRENYLAAARYAHGRALDCFTSTGGFAMHLARSCESVEAVDSSEAALLAANENRISSRIANIQYRQADAFELLAGYAAARRQFQTVVLDPPAFAKSRKSLQGAARGYKEINLRALRLLAPGGVLVTCSCSQHMSEAELLGIVAEASLDARRQLRVLERRAQAQDHPILLTVPETHYLKCLIFQVV